MMRVAAEFQDRTAVRGVHSSSGTPSVLFVRIPSWLHTRARHPENCEAPLDLGYCCTLASARGFTPTIYDLETGLLTVEHLVDAIRKERPAAVFISGITPAVMTMVEVARRTRQVSVDTLIAAVGQHADYFPGSFLFEGSPFDLTTVSEFELTVDEILSRLATGADWRVPGTATFENGAIVLHGSRPLIADLDSLGMPDHRFFLNPVYRYLHPMQTPARRRWGFIQASRGCPCSCIYCSKTLRTSFGPQMRFRSPESVVDEMKWLRAHGLTTLVFTDDLFCVTKERVMNLCEHILRSGVRIGWTAHSRVKPADVEMFKLMKKAGCSTFSMGVESGSPAILRTLDKKTEVDDVVHAFAAAREAGLLRVAYFMVASPGETVADFEMTRKLLRRIRPEMIQVANFTCYPGSRAYEVYLKSRKVPWERFQHYEELINFSAESDSVARKWQTRLYMDLATDPMFPFRYIIGQNVGLLMNLDKEFLFALQAARRLMRPTGADRCPK